MGYAGAPSSFRHGSRVRLIVRSSGDGAPQCDVHGGGERISNFSAREQTSGHGRGHAGESHEQRLKNTMTILTGGGSKNGNKSPVLTDRSDLFENAASRNAPLATFEKRMDWSAVATLLAERGGVSGVLVDPDGEILLVTPAAQRTLGWTFDYLGSNWVDRCVPAELSSEARWTLGRAALGGVRRFDLEILTADGPRLATFESSPVGARDDRGVLLVVEKTTAVQRPRPSVEDDYDYEVHGARDGEFEMRMFWKLGASGEPARGKCYDVLHGRRTPCERCPLTNTGAQQRERVVIRTRGDREHTEYEIVSASSSGGNEARVSVRRLQASAFLAILHLRLGELAGRAKLSERERDVLNHLVEGLPIEEVAKTLSISPRTVKFHQANLLAKLGADSRSDLMRLVLWGTR